MMRIIASLIALSMIASAADYYVATNGDDNNSGLEESAPLASIQLALNQMKLGDTCYLKEGRYHEVINLNGKAGSEGKPLTLKSYQGDTVVIDGTEAIDSKWVLDKGNVYKTTVSKGIPQLFVDGRQMTLARYPNALAYSDQAFNEFNRLEKGAGSKRGIVKDNPNPRCRQTLAQAGVNFTGCIAILNFGDHITSALPIQDHQAGSDTFKHAPNIKIKNTKGYFIEGGIGNAERVMLDSAEEWAFDESNGTLYLWTVDGKIYRVAVFGQDEKGKGKAIQHLTIEKKL